MKKLNKIFSEIKKLNKIFSWIENVVTLYINSEHDIAYEVENDYVYIEYEGNIANNKYPYYLCYGEDYEEKFESFEELIQFIKKLFQDEEVRE